MNYCIKLSSELLYAHLNTDLLNLILSNAINKNAQKKKKKIKQLHNTVTG